MTEEELKKLAEEYQRGLKEVEEVQREYNEMFENLSEEELKIALDKQLEEWLEDARNAKIERETLSKKSSNNKKIDK